MGGHSGGVRRRRRAVGLGLTVALAVAATTSAVVRAPTDDGSDEVPHAAADQHGSRDAGGAASGNAAPPRTAVAPRDLLDDPDGPPPEPWPAGEAGWLAFEDRPRETPGLGNGDPAANDPDAGAPLVADVDPAAVTREGFLVVPGDAAAGEGRVVRYSVEVEPDLDVTLAEVGQVVDDALLDSRSWVRDLRLERVEDPAEANVRVLLASPATVDRLCGAVGLRTNGRYSCWTGTFAALNAWRWDAGASDFESVDAYRRYLVNHEVGHGIGRGHVGCPAPGAPAPVMMQQSIGTGACVANPWPYPDAPG